MSPDDTGRSDRSGEFHDRDGRTLPERIRERRTARRLKSLEVAQALDVSPAYVTMIERGKKVPSEDVAVAIARLLGDDPELYRAWVHSTRFTDPRSTLRGLQRLFYSGPGEGARTPANARIISASQRALRRKVDAPPPDSVAEPDESIAFLRARRVPRTLDARVNRLDMAPPQTTSAAPIPLIALGGLRGDEVRFWRLPWALLDNDSRPRRFVVAATGRPDTLLVATPREFVDIVMKEQGWDLMNSPGWRGWQDRPEPDSSGGVLAQPLDPRGRLAPLLSDKRGFLDSLGEHVDVIVRAGDSISIRRLTLADFSALLN